MNRFLSIVYLFPIVNSLTASEISLIAILSSDANLRKIAKDTVDAISGIAPAGETHPYYPVSIEEVNKLGMFKDLNITFPDFDREVVIAELKYFSPKVTISAKAGYKSSLTVVENSKVKISLDNPASLAKSISNSFKNANITFKIDESELAFSLEKVGYKVNLGDNTTAAIKVITAPTEYGLGIIEIVLEQAVKVKATTIYEDLIIRMSNVSTRQNLAVAMIPPKTSPTHVYSDLEIYAAFAGVLVLTTIVAVGIAVAPEIAPGVIMKIGEVVATYKYVTS